MVRSIDIIEINPLLDQSNTTAELAVELIFSCLGGSYGDYERFFLTDRYRSQEKYFGVQVIFSDQNFINYV